MARNLSSATPSVDAMIANAQTYGPWNVQYFGQVGASTTAATTTSGGVTGQRFPTTITVPSVDAALDGFVITQCDLATGNNSMVMFCLLETLLGTLTISGNSYSAGSSMPTKTVAGSSVTTASSLALLVVDSALTATAPVITITYTDQGGTGSQTATLTLPNSPAVNTAFLINKHLASGDSGIRSISNISTSTGSAGVLKAYGGLVVGVGVTGGAGGGCSGVDMGNSPLPLYVCAAGETLAFYRFGFNTAQDMYATLTGMPEPS